MTKKFTVLFKFVFFLYVISVICLMVLTLNTDQMTLPKQFVGIDIDKIVHFFLFFPYPILAWLSFSGSGSGRLNCRILSTIALSGLFLGALTESAQLLNHYRTFDPNDMIANFLAIITSSLVILIICLIKNHRLTRIGNQQ